ncbi:DNA repair endonuclease UVH1 isoform X2 [Prosopis cineraria]|uniref:DNA repair endonuclease UVH1 isoform X2 n=1 Tax=Prosopis cineraria TaxID=364024 RepID=UPI00240EBC74|nr:DNA repair endonuclease UVH1 isoform X2 [Prosopis cineraria]
MVQFHEHIITDLLDDSNGGLVILSSGLSLPKLISSLLLLHSSSQGTLLILSSSSSSLKSKVFFQLKAQNPQFQQIPSEITADLPAHHRHSLYSSGLIFFITPRILIVDLLTNKLPTSNIAGLIILNAHSLSETSTEAFIVRIIRSLNRDAYIWAFSDKPQAMISGFAKVERTMKFLYIRKLHLWPRFQVYVSQELEKAPPDVVDIRVPMTKYMMGIQKAIIEVMDACLKEMRKTNKVDVEDLTVENGLFKSFDEIVRRQLDPIWHTLGKKTKQLVSDLKTLRKLLDYLVRYDAITFLRYLDTLRVSESFRSVWIFAEGSYKIFDYAKKRVYRLERSDGVKLTESNKNVKSKKRKCKGDDNDRVEVDGSLSKSSNTGLILEEVLEEAPKWKVLREVLEEIEEERQKQGVSGEEVLIEGEGIDNGIVLVVCKDERSCLQLEECIINSPKKVMAEEWRKYLLSKLQLRDVVRQKKKPKDPKGFGVLDGVTPMAPVQNAEASISKQEHDALLIAASGIRDLAEKDCMVEDTPGLDSCKRKCGKGKNKVGSKNGPVTADGSGVHSSKKVSTSDNLWISDSKNNGQMEETNPVGSGGTTVDNLVLRRHSNADATGSMNAKPLPPVHFYALESDQSILDALQPSVIIVYHPDMTFVREIEVYKSENPSKRLKVYFFFYEDSTEVQKFEASIRRENGAFESLIRQKSMMMIPVDQDGRCLGLNSTVEGDLTTSQNSITRKAGGRKEADKETQVIVDMREFMSSLPNVLHQKGMRIIPVTLEVETMVRYYRIPVLLIEFSQDKSFSFQSASDIGDDVTPNSIISKLSLLALHFPRLRIIWSRSLHATAEIFASLKANQDEPDETKAMRVGVPSEGGIVENDVRAENYNTSAVEFLRRLPGITDSNYRAIMESCKSLAELALLPMEKLAELMGGQKAARTLREFLDAKYPTLL